MHEKEGWLYRFSFSLKRWSLYIGVTKANVPQLYFPVTYIGILTESTLREVQRDRDKNKLFDPANMNSIKKYIQKTREKKGLPSLSSWSFIAKTEKEAGKCLSRI